MEYGRCRIVKEWSDWDYSIHTDDAQIARQAKALTYPFTFEIDKESNTAKFSSSSDLPYYTTSLSDCNCGDFNDRHLPCKHIYRLAVELGVIEIIRRKAGGQNRELLSEVKASEDIDSHPEQIKRIEKAKEVKCKPLFIDKENKTGVFGGSGKIPYETTVDSCTCRDYFVRRLPCKHIYRLRMELGLMDEENGNG